MIVQGPWVNDILVGALKMRDDSISFYRGKMCICVWMRWTVLLSLTLSWQSWHGFFLVISSQLQWLEESSLSNKASKFALDAPPPAMIGLTTPLQKGSFRGLLIVSFFGELWFIFFSRLFLLSLLAWFTPFYLSCFVLNQSLSWVSLTNFSAINYSLTSFYCSVEFLLKKMQKLNVKETILTMNNAEKQVKCGVKIC